MNDFTKEELQYLHMLLMSKDMDGTWITGLNDRLKYLIETYCEHEWINSEQEQSYFECKKCGDEAL